MHDGRAWLRNQAQRKVPMVTVIRPEYNPKQPIRLGDYIEVPREAIIGTWSVLDMLSDDSVRNTIEIYNRLKGFAAPQRKIKVKLPA